MEKNIGNTDRLIRLVLAFALFMLHYFGFISGTLGIALLVVALVLVLTSTVRFCPLYLPFSIRTNRRDKA